MSEPSASLVLTGHATNEPNDGLMIDGRPLGEVIAAAFGYSTEEYVSTQHLGTLRITVEKLSHD